MQGTGQKPSASDRRQSINLAFGTELEQGLFSMQQVKQTIFWFLIKIRGIGNTLGEHLFF